MVGYAFASIGYNVHLFVVRRHYGYHHVGVGVDIKSQAAEALDSMGLSISDAVRVLLNYMASEKALPFAVKLPNAATLAAMNEDAAGLRSPQR